MGSNMCLSVFVMLFALARAIPIDNLDDEWEAYKLMYEKTYSAGEELKRRSIWEHGRETVNAHNLEYEEGKHSFFMGINHFSDLTEDEFRSVMLMDKSVMKNAMLKEQGDPMPDLGDLRDLPIPRHLDWRDYGAVTPVKNQGKCGSCYSFAATGAIEGQHFKKRGKLLSLSEQQIVDCSKNYGCNGGYATTSFKYVIDNYYKGGLAQEKDYPYYASEKSCYELTGNETARITSFHVIPKEDELSLTAAVYLYGPIAVAITVPPYFFIHGGGILHCISNKEEDMEHAVLIVGFGEENGQEYYIVKNSFGTRWGEDGYFRIARNKGNACGIAHRAAFPKIEDEIETSRSLFNDM